VRGQGKASGAIGFALIFFLPDLVIQAGFLFLSRKKENKQKHFFVRCKGKTPS